MIGYPSIPLMGTGGSIQGTTYNQGYFNPATGQMLPQNGIFSAAYPQNPNLINTADNPVTTYYGNTPGGGAIPSWYAGGGIPGQTTTPTPTGPTTGGGGGTPNGWGGWGGGAGDNPLQLPIQRVINAGAGLQAGYSPLFQGAAGSAIGMLSSGSTALENQMLDQAMNKTMQQMAARYEGTPGHSQVASSVGEQMANVAGQMAMQRQQYVPQFLSMAGQGVAGASQMPLNAMLQGLQAGQSAASMPIQSLLGAWQGMPYEPTTVVAGGGGK